MKVLFGLWLILTAVHQTQTGRKATRWIDPFGIYLPLWTFFGPIPGTTDSELVVRYYTADGTAVGEWRHAHLYESRRWLHALFHRNRRFEKVVSDAGGQITANLRKDVRIDQMMRSNAYITLLNAAQLLVTRPTGSARIQFMLVTSSGYDSRPSTTTPAFLSAIHDLP